MPQAPSTQRPFDAVVSDIKSFLASQSLNYGEVKPELLMVPMDDQRFFFQIHDKSGCVDVVSTYDNCPEEYLEEAAALITYANFGLRLGAFLLDWSDGEIRYVCGCLGAFMSSEELLNSLPVIWDTALKVAFKYLPAIKAVLGGTKANEALLIAEPGAMTIDLDQVAATTQRSRVPPGDPGGPSASQPSSASSSTITPSVQEAKRESKDNVYVKLKANELVVSSDRIGRGRLGEVWKGRYFTTVSVRTMGLGKGDRNEVERKMVAEELTHISEHRFPRLVQTLGAVFDGDRWNIVMEYCENGALCDFLHSPSSSASLIPKLRLRLAKETAEALAYLHAQDVTHGDLKTANLLLTEDNHIKVSDFGLQKLALFASTVPDISSWPYTAPEVFKSNTYTEKSDVYSFGICLYEIFTSKKPFDYIRADLILQQVSTLGVRPTVPNDLSEPKKQLLRKCWHDDPTQRPSMAQVLTALEAISE